MTAVTRELARFAAEISYDALPAEVRERVKAFTLDLVGIMRFARATTRSRRRPWCPPSVTWAWRAAPAPSSATRRATRRPARPC